MSGDKSEDREGKPKYADLADLPEDERIPLIGKRAMAGEVVAFIVDDEDGKLDRYLFKLFTLFPDLILVGKWPGPVEGAVTAKVKHKGTPDKWTK